MSDDALKEIPVLVSDLENLLGILDSAYSHQQVLDLAEAYRKLNQRAAASAMTKALEEARDKVKAYVEAAKDA